MQRNVMILMNALLKMEDVHKFALTLMEVVHVRVMLVTNLILMETHVMIGKLLPRKWSAMAMKPVHIQIQSIMLQLLTVQSGAGVNPVCLYLVELEVQDAGGLVVDVAVS